jgi:crotonobetainyl-CoA:carnitine CoA-transferase CaiB-like acyl-CoA transferase
VNNQESLNKQVKLFDSEQIQADFERLGLCCAPMMSYDEWLQHPQGKLLAQMPVIDIGRHGDGSGRRVLPPARYRPLEGVRVIDITHVVAGPWATRLLADQGADVISVRNPHFPFLYPMIFEESYGKKQIFLDFRRKEEKDRLIELIRTADVLLWGYHAPALDRLRLSVEDLQKLNPDLILARNTGYGVEGPWANRKGWEQLAQTCTGAMEIASRRRKNKHLIASLPSDYGSGYLCATGVMSALRQRQAQGGGFYTVNTSLCKTIMLALGLAQEAEAAEPVTVEDMKSYLVDQTWDGKTTYSRIKPAAELSVTPFYCVTPPSAVGSLDAFRTDWDNTPPQKTEPGHKPSEYAAQGLLRSVLPGFGHEDWMLNIVNH